MSSTLVNELADQVQKFWSPLLKDELKEDTLLPSLVSREYDGQIKQGGDTVYVSQVNRPTGSTKTIGVDHDTYNPEKLTTTRISISANKIFEASFKLDSLIDLQTQLGSPEGKSAIRKALLESLEIQMNNYIYSFVSPSTSSPDHLVNGVSDFNASEAGKVRKLAAQAKWAKDGRWFGLLDPSYYSDFLNASTLTSLDNGASDEPLIGGQFAKKRFGFNWLEDNSDALANLAPSTSGEDSGLIFHQDWFHLVAGQPTWKLSDLHAGEKRGYLLSVEILGGGALGIDGNLKHIHVYNN